MTTGEAKSAKLNGSQVFDTLWKAHRNLLARAEKSYSHIGLCESDFKVLIILLKDGPKPVNTLGNEVELTTGSITTAIDRLEAKWLVMRKHHPTDRRVRVVELTAKGQRLIEKGQLRHASDLDDAVKVLSTAERETLMKLLARLTASRSDHRT